MASGLFTLKQVNQAVQQGGWSGYIAPKWVEYLVVAGGGGCGVVGGGGAGGLLTGIVTVAAGTSYTVTVGGGGGPITVGTNTSFGSITTTGGGTAGASNGFGGSGGGAGHSGTIVAGQAVSGQGNRGGNNLTGGVTGTGGGGGAGTVGLDGTSSGGGNGGAGIGSSITGTLIVYAGGGGGFGTAGAGSGGVGGGGNAVSNATGGENSGSANTGGGAGGTYAVSGGAGGSGIVVVRYPGTVQFFTGGTVTYSNGYIVHNFTASGTLAPTTPTVVSEYQISRSLRFNSADSAYLNRTPASATNQKTWTWSAWVKRGTISSLQTLFGTWSSNTDATAFAIIFGGGDTISVLPWTNSIFTSTAVFRDPSAWYHIVVAFDSTQATASNRVIVYVNGVNQAGTYPLAVTQGANYAINSAQSHRLGDFPASGFNTFGGYMTEVNFIDGQALPPTSFGYVNPSTGVWSPAKFVGGYGTNGFYLNFSDNSNTTAATLGKDYSPNGNNWTPNNFSVTAGAGNDSLVDSPTSYGVDTGVGGTVRGNYATLNPLDKNSGTCSDGNLLFTDSGPSAWDNSRATIIPSAGKWYWEVAATNDTGVLCASIASPKMPLGFLPGQSSNFGVTYYTNGALYSNTGQQASWGSSWTTGDVIGVALDMDSGKVWFSKNGTWQASGDPANGTNPARSSLLTLDTLWGPISGTYFSGSSQSFNFGQRPFAYTAPAGYKALCTQNLPVPAIGATTATQANTFFAPALYTGNDGTQTVTTGIDMATSGGLVWFKNRSAAVGHALINPVVGYGSFLQSNTTGAENAFSFITATSSTGFTMNTGSSTFNGGAAAGGPFAYVAWNWKANGSGSTNTAGSITSTVSANTTSGFSVVTFTATANSGSIGHGLGVAPSMIILKSRNNTSNWVCYHASLGADKYINLDSTAASVTNTATWQNTTPTSTVFYSNGPFVSGYTEVAYCFAEVAGYSKFGSYTGNGSTDGVFVYLGFRPAYMMIKASNAVDNWVIMDVARNPYNAVNYWLQAESSAAEATLTPPQFDFVSNGMKLRGTSSTCNGSGVTYIYMAFASNPFKTSLAR